ncbi:MAG: glycosyltransferase [Syntrophaceae bacterium]|nr:glycosyltransferase [Syntrophaceae bacterium]
MSSVKPLFSIGVTAYNRNDLLRESLHSLLMQEFADFEVIVGNDYPPSPISSEILGIEDSRIRLVNYPENIGPINNANTLLAMAKGSYFTWLADDDILLPNYLKAVYDGLGTSNNISCVFTSYCQGEHLPENLESKIDRVELFEGSDFLNRYLLRDFRVIGNYGVFETECLRGIGGMVHLGNGYFSPYSDNLLAIQAGLLSHIMFIHADLVFFRTHESSSSYGNANIEIYRTAQRDLLSKSIDILKNTGGNGVFQVNLFRLLQWCILDFESVVRRSEAIGVRQAGAYLSFVNQYLPYLKGSPYYGQTLRMVLRIIMKYVRDFVLRPKRTGA